MKNKNRTNGFTIVELLVGIAITTLLSVVLVAYMVATLSQSAVSTTRSTMSSGIQTALARINDDIRTASGVSLCNLIPDDSAPLSVSGAAANVPCEDDPSNANYRTFWRLTANQLILNRTPVSAAGNSIYDDADTQTGSRDVIVYYIKGDSLYRRVVPAPYATPVANVEQLVPCAATPAGGCDNDTRLVSGLKLDESGGPFKLKYYNAAGTEITAASPTANYDNFLGTRSIDVSISLTATQNGQTISMTNTSKMNLRNTGLKIPNYEPQLPSDYNLPAPSMMAGPGGFIGGQFVNIKGGSAIYVKGKFTIDRFSDIGTPSTYTTPAIPTNLYIANTACGSGNSFPSVCGAGSEPIDIVSSPVNFVGPVCATGRTATYARAPGLILPCTAPVKELPALDKQAFVTSMKAGVSSSATSGTCPASLQANKTYQGDLFISCPTSELKGNMYIKGNLTVRSFHTMTVSESAGKKRPVIVVNGKIKFNGFTTISPNSYGTMPYFVSMFSDDTVCSVSDSCTSISGASLQTTLNNHTSGDAPVSLAVVDAGSTVFYSYFGETYVGGLTNAGSMAGQRLRIPGLITIDLTTTF